METKIFSSTEEESMRDFKRHLVLAEEKSEEGIKAKFWLGQQYQANIDDSKTSEENERNFTCAVGYYTGALKLAKELALDTDVTEALSFLGSLGKYKNTDATPVEALPSRGRSLNPF